MTAPLFSVVTPVYNPPPAALWECIESVRAQTWTDWELVLVDDCSTDPRVGEVLRQAAGDSRVRVVRREANGGIVAASNDGLAAARGQFVALLDHDDLLEPEALDQVAAVLDDQVDYVYTDEDKLDAEGGHYEAFAKPDWSPERLRGQMYTGHLSVLRRSLVETVGGFRQEFEGSQDHDLALRVTEAARVVVHVPQVLYHWRVVPSSTAGDATAKPYAREAGRRAVEDHCARVGIHASVTQHPQFPGHYLLHREVAGEPVVSVVIPTRGSSGLVWGQRRVFVTDAVRSLLAHTDYPRLEVVLVVDAGFPAQVRAELAELLGDRARWVEYDRAFNFSEKVNLGVLSSAGEVLLIVNDDIEMLSDGWVETLVALVQDPQVGLAGAKLFYADSTVQHGGHTYHDGHLGHVWLGYPRDSPGEFGSLLINRECTGVTFACVAVRRDVYEEVGGLTETLPSNFNDVDFCLKVQGLGLRAIWTPLVEAYHFESRSRERVVHAWEYDVVDRRWHYELLRDRYNPTSPLSDIIA